MSGLAERLEAARALSSECIDGETKVECAFVHVPFAEFYALLREAAADIKAHAALRERVAGAQVGRVIGTTFFDDFLRYEIHTDDTTQDMGGCTVALVSTYGLPVDAEQESDHAR